MTGTLGPSGRATARRSAHFAAVACESASSTATSTPSCARHTAKLVHKVLLPTPPFSAPTTTIVAVVLSCRLVVMVSLRYGVTSLWRQSAIRETKSARRPTGISRRDHQAIYGIADLVGF